MRFLWAVAALVLAGSVATACGQDELGSPNQQMSTWVRGTAFTDVVGTLRSDVDKAASLLASNPAAAQVHTVCGVLLVEVQAANSGLPSPDKTTTPLLSSAYHSLQDAATYCYDAVGNPTSASKFSGARSAGLARLSEAQLEVESLLGTRLHVTTTTSPSTRG